MIVRGLAVILALGVAGGAVAGEKKGAINVPAPDFRVTTVTGQKIDLASLHGQVVVVNRWATWCVPCREEFVMFDRYSALRAPHGFTIIAIESGGHRGSSGMTKIARMVSFPVVLENQARGATRYPVLTGVPTNYVIDRAGVVRYAKAGAFDLKELDRVVLPLLNEPVPAT
jgi:cytochrome c biogenesis protein CcmG, thiol:disulfide interchange protein DsbE